MSNGRSSKLWMVNVISFILFIVLRAYLQNKGLRECDVFDSPALGSAQVDA